MARPAPRHAVTLAQLIGEALLIFTFFAGLGFALVIAGAFLAPMPGV